MKRTRHLWLLLAVVIIFSMMAPAYAQDGPKPGGVYNLAEYEEMTGETLTFSEAPMLAEKVAAGELPPVEERLPDNPVVIVPWNEIGEYGGTVRWDEYTPNYDHYLRHLFNMYMAWREPAQVPHYNSGPTGPAEPWIIESWSSNPEATEYTITLRKGLKWSDGAPVTTEDVRYRVEDEILNEELTVNPSGWLRWNPERQGVTSTFEVIDEYTFKVSFVMPYGVFINQEFRDSSWVSWLAPSHYLKQYHKDYTDIEELLPIMDEQGFPEEEQWANFYGSVQATNLGDCGGYVRHPFPTELPVLYPWTVEEVYDDGSFLFTRNPYYFVVDSAGNQLPYLDHMNRQFIASSELMNLDIIAGNTDVQTQFIRIADFPLFKENEEQGNYIALPKRAWQHHVLIYWLNPSVDDEQLRAAVGNVEFRKALSIALDRDFINESIFLGLGTPAQFAPAQGTAIYSEELSNYAAEYDAAGAEAILDELGYVDVDGDGWREDPEGNDFLLPILFYEVTPAAVPGAQIAEEYWEAVGIEVDTKQVEGSTFWENQGANAVALSIWWANGPDFRDGAFISHAVNADGWDTWRWSENHEAGVEPPDWVKRIWEIQQERLKVATAEERNALDAEGWELLTKNLTIIGTVEGAKNPLILNADLGNVQYGFDKDFVPQTFLEWAFQWYYTNPERR